MLLCASRQIGPFSAAKDVKDLIKSSKKKRPKAILLHKKLYQRLPNSPKQPKLLKIHRRKPFQEGQKHPDQSQIPISAAQRLDLCENQHPWTWKLNILYKTPPQIKKQRKVQLKIEYDYPLRH